MATFSLDAARMYDEAMSRLEAAGLAVSYREDRVGHTIAPGGLAQAITVLSEALP